MGLAAKVQRAFLKDERGSISILIMGLFLLSVITLMVLTNISSVYLAKRTLTQATEAAAQRGVRNLDLSKVLREEIHRSEIWIEFIGW